MARKKKEEEIQPEAAEETPVEAKPLQGRLSKPDMARKNSERLVSQAEARKEAKAKERADWQAKLKAKLDKSQLDSVFLGKVIAYTEKNGSVCPAIFIGEREQHKKVNGLHQYDANGHAIMEFVAIVLVLSSTTSQPYKADYEI